MKNRKLALIYEGEMQSNGRKSQRKTTYNNLTAEATNQELRKVTDAISGLTENPPIRAVAITEEEII